MMTESFLSLFVLPHVLAGSVALLTFWTSGLSRKGSTIHRYSGRVYLIAMALIVVSGIPLTLLSAVRGNMPAAIFLGYLLILVSYNCMNAWRAIRSKRDFQRYSDRLYRISALVLGLAGIAVVLLGIQVNMVILIAFGTIGPITAWQAFGLIRKGPRDGRWWLREHFGAMIGNGVATHIAFLQIGLSSTFRSLDLVVIQNLAWLAPLAVGVIVGVMLHRKYRVSKAA